MATRTAASGGGNWSDTGTWEEGQVPVAGDDVVFDSGSGNVTLTADAACSSVNMTGSTATLAVGTYNLIISGNLNIGEAATVTVGASSDIGLSFHDLIVSYTYGVSTGLLSCTGASKITCSGGWSTPQYCDGWRCGESTVNYTSTGTETLELGWVDASHTWYNVVFSGSGGHYDLLTAYRFIVTNSLVVEDGATFDGTGLGLGVAINIAGGITLDSGTYIMGTNVFGSDTSLTVTTGCTMTFSTGGLSAGTAYTGDLTIDGTATVTFSGAGYVVGVVGADVTITSPNFDPGQAIVTVHGWWNTVYANISVPVYDLVIGAPGAGTVKLLADLEVLNNLNIQPSEYGGNTVLDANGYNILVGGNWTNNDISTSFVPGSNAVEFNDAAQESIIGGSAATTFNILRCQTPGKTVKFKALQTVTVASFDFDGGSGNRIVLDTDTGADTWTLSDDTGTNSVTNCAIYRSVAEGGAVFEALISNGNQNGGGNSGWDFGESAVIGPFPTFLRV